MARSVADAFQVMIERQKPLTKETDARLRHRRTITSALANKFDSPKVKVFGSHTRGTAIRHHSDIDYLATLKSADVTWGGSLMSSTTLLGHVRAALDSALPKTRVRVDGCGVVVEFGGGDEAVDVIPGVYAGTVSATDGYPMFKIPAPGGDWLATSPERHGKFLKGENERSRYQLQRTIQLLKAWKYRRSPTTPLLGFHLEALLAGTEVCVGPRSYQNCLVDAFRLLRDRNGAAYRDPVGISGNIPAAFTGAKRRLLAERANSAYTHALKALNAEVAGYRGEAFKQWDIVFNGTFPSKWG